MNKDEFLGYLEIYGANIACWPDDKRTLASPFFQSKDDDIRLRIQEEAEFEAVLNMSDVHEPIDMALEARLIDLVPHTATNNKLSVWGRLKALSAPKWASAGLISAALMSGVGVGYAQAAEQAELNAINDMLAYASVEELSELDSSAWSQLNGASDD
ncbi:hypothetical protein [Hirschia litorea]|uniref:DUF4376 domain-containing protein n=1 Tax=Hirschia litorea TaxID=1199156 RepID=A0ABW2IJ50_9PROT